MPQKLPIKQFEDNRSCVKMIQQPKYMSGIKHVDVKYNSIRNLSENGIIALTYQPTRDMIADIMTKPLPKPDFIKY